MVLTRLSLGSPVEADAFEEFAGEAEFAVDPSHPRNPAIVDLELASRDADGRVRFTADVRILRPRGVVSRGLFLDVPNRGQSIFARMLEPGPLGPTTAVTEGFLFRRGFTVVTCGWQHDVPRGNGRGHQDVPRADGRFGLTAPQALLDGQPLIGPVTTTRQIDAPTNLLVPDSTYRPLDAASASLVEHDDPHGPGRAIPRDDWHLAADGSAYYVFEPGKTYVLTFMAQGSAVTGVGLLALCDIVAHVRELYDLRFALAMGASQTGRLLRQLVALGLCVDEAGDPVNDRAPAKIGRRVIDGKPGKIGRRVIDGVLAIAAGARFADVNSRFAQPSSQEPSVASPIDAGLAHARERGTAPKLMLLNTSSEYCSSSSPKHLSAALSHIAPDGHHDLEQPDDAPDGHRHREHPDDAPHGHRDLEMPDDVRLYLAASTQHAPAPLGATDPRGVNPPNSLDYKPFVRACVDSLTAWVVDGTLPPPSLYPRFADGTLTADLWPAVDADGHEVGGIRHPDVSVPLATFTGWNPRHPSIGAPHLMLRATGSTIPWPREPILERYATREAFLSKIRAAAERLAAERYILPEDRDSIVAASAARWDHLMPLGTLSEAATSTVRG